MSSPDTLYLACPFYGGQKPDASTVIQAMLHHQPVQNVLYEESSISLLANNFNRLWCYALNKRQQFNITRFLMLHSDIRPMQADWVEIMLSEMDRLKAPVVSALMPIKDERGLTSTGWDTEDRFSPKRMTMVEAEQIGVSYTHPKLLINTGLMLVDFTQPWIEEVCFTINDEIRTAEHPETKAKYFYPAVEPEDWNFSRWLIARGIPRYVTRALKAVHQGNFNYPNFGGWGASKVDEGDRM
jgi:hypothetical protein